MANWNSAEVVVALAPSGRATRRFHQVDIDDSNFLTCYHELRGEDYCQIRKDKVTKVYFNLNVQGKNQTIVVWENPAYSSK